MVVWNPAANEVFLQAVEISSPEQTEEFLETMCAADANCARRWNRCFPRTRTEAAELLKIETSHTDPSASPKPSFTVEEPEP